MLLAHGRGLQGLLPPLPIETVAPTALTGGPTHRGILGSGQVDHVGERTIRPVDAVYGWVFAIGRDDDAGRFVAVIELVFGHARPPNKKGSDQGSEPV